MDWMNFQNLSLWSTQPPLYTTRCGMRRFFCWKPVELLSHSVFPPRVGETFLERGCKRKGGRKPSHQWRHSPLPFPRRWGYAHLIIWRSLAAGVPWKWGRGWTNVMTMLWCRAIFQCVSGLNSKFSFQLNSSKGIAHLCLSLAPGHVCPSCCFLNCLL